MKNPRFSYASITLLLALYFSLVLNIPIYAKLAQIFSAAEQFNWGFAFSIPIFFFLALNVIFQLFSWPYFLKPFFAVLLILSAVVSYASYNYGTIVDRDMLINVVETNSSEAGSYVSLYSIVWIFALGILPAVLLLLSPLKVEKSISRFLGYKALSILLSLLGIVIIAALYYQNYSSVGRNNSYLKKMIIPTHFVYSAYGLVKDRYFTEPVVYQIIGADAQQQPKTTHSRDAEKPTLVLFVLGETARAQNYQYYGYTRDTNAYTAFSLVI